MFYLFTINAFLNVLGHDYRGGGGGEKSKTRCVFRLLLIYYFLTLAPNKLKLGGDCSKWEEQTSDLQ